MESQLVIALSVLVLGWYFVGQQAMRRRGLGLLHWVRDGMHLLGDKPTLRWLGAAAFQLTVERPAQPFKAVAVTVVLEPREIVFLWLVNRFRQRRDLLVLRGDLTARPPMQCELFRAQGRSGQEAQALVRSAGWPVMPFDNSGLRLAASSPLSRDLLHAAIPRLQDHLSALVRLSIHDTSPHLLLNYTLRPGQEGHAGQVFGLALELARLLREARG